jgi:hypothetical protein
MWNMNSLHVRAWALLAGLAIGTALIIRFSYDPITLYKTPYLRASVLLTLLTWLYAEIGAIRMQPSFGTFVATVVYSLMFMPWNFVLTLPDAVLPFRPSVAAMIVAWHGLGYALAMRVFRERDATP